ncbi:hypothetical protein BDB01DRAFT_730696 [Pilobolus umbonatus]|nr:hypothetical protein BDB01DRAFT_730696 [Pilobolus umbonatus]
MDIVDLETPRLELLSVKDSIDVTAHKTEDRVDKTEDEMDKTEVKREFSLKRKRVGESVFTRDAVKGWQSSRIKAWENRYVNPEGYYFRFVVPGEGQQNGSWCKEEVELFMARYKEWVANGWKVGASWGLFSKGIPHRVGYQCMNHYRKLVNDGILKDASYGIVDGKLKQLYKDRAPAGDIPNTELGSIWDSAEVKEEEENVNRWLKEFHSRSGASTTSRPISTPKPKMTRVVKKTNEKLNILSLVKRMPKKKMISEDDDFMSESEPELIHLPQHNWDDEWNKRLDKYKEFLM